MIDSALPRTSGTRVKAKIKSAVFLRWKELFAMLGLERRGDLFIHSTPVYAFCGLRTKFPLAAKTLCKAK